MSKPTIDFYKDSDGDVFDSLELEFTDMISFNADIWMNCTPSLKIQLSRDNLKDLQKVINKHLKENK